MATKKFQIVDGPERMGLMISLFQYWECVNFTLIPIDVKSPARMRLSCQIIGLARRPKGSGDERSLSSDFEIEGFGCGGGWDMKKIAQPVRAPDPSD
ncbi:MAG: hypothetical protein Q8P23_01065, partial [bacterium]|nr:hypothetical protein [bacterium]